MLFLTFVNSVTLLLTGILFFNSCQASANSLNEQGESNFRKSANELLIKQYRDTAKRIIDEATGTHRAFDRLSPVM